jgi:hypothetical protein
MPIAGIGLALPDLSTTSGTAVMNAIVSSLRHQRRTKGVLCD